MTDQFTTDELRKLSEVAGHCNAYEIEKATMCDDVLVSCANVVTWTRGTIYIAAHEDWDCQPGIDDLIEWQPHTDIAQAFEVVEGMKQYGRWMMLVDNASECEGYTNKWLCKLACARESDVVDFGETPTIAICRAALKVIGGTDD